jgi:hypothetical protein
MILNVQNEISDYWDTQDITPSYLISKYITRDRFQELYIRYWTTLSRKKGPYEQIGLLPNH